MLICVNCRQTISFMGMDLERFLKAQNLVYLQAMQEVRSGQKRSHWMWYIFPQITNLGSSDTARYYAIRDGGEAKAFLAHPVLGENLRMISKVLLGLQGYSAQDIFGTVDALKLRSCMTLFDAVSEKETIFKAVIEKYFAGKLDSKTIAILQALDS